MAMATTRAQDADAAFHTYDLTLTDREVRDTGHERVVFVLGFANKERTAVSDLSVSAISSGCNTLASTYAYDTGSSGTARSTNQHSLDSAAST
jgi:hypothetical protein